MSTIAANHIAVAMPQVETSFPRFSHSFFPTAFFLVIMARCNFSLFGSEEATAKFPRDRSLKISSNDPQQDEF